MNQSKLEVNVADAKGGKRVLARGFGFTFRLDEKVARILLSQACSLRIQKRLLFDTQVETALTIL